MTYKITEGYPDNVLLQIILKNKRDGNEPDTKLLPKSKINDMLTNWVNYLIDYKDIDIEDVIFKVIAIKIPCGTGRKNNTIINLDVKRCIIQIKNNDTICLARAIVVALSLHKEELQKVFKDKLAPYEIKEINRKKQIETQIHKGIISDNEIKYIRDGVKIQAVLAQAFHRICAICIKPGGNDFMDIKLIEQKLDIKIQVYDMAKKQIYEGTERATKIYLILDGNHYNVISKLPAFLGTNLRTWEKNQLLKCKACGNNDKCENQNKTTCQQCNKLFYSQGCFNDHVTNHRCIDHSYVCPKCLKFNKTKVRKQKDHVCGESYCSNCKEWCLDDHYCYMQKSKVKESSVNYIFYDFETKLDKKNMHVVNYCIAHYYDGTEFIFHNLDDFCKWMFTKKHKNFTVLAHYGKGYDIQFVQEWLVNHSLKPDVILNGQKILQLEVKNDYNIRFIDSISFTLMPLRDFPKTFGLDELSKGYFPYKFNTDENQNYKGPYPDKLYYGYEEMTKKNREDFDVWYKSIKDQT